MLLKLIYLKLKGFRKRDYKGLEYYTNGIANITVGYIQSHDFGSFKAIIDKYSQKQKLYLTRISVNQR